MCSKAPKPDPLIGQAAKSNAELAKEQTAIAREQLAWEKARAEKQDPLLEKIVNQQIASGEKNAARADEQWNIYRDLFHPVEQRMVEDANAFDSAERKSRMAAEAGADVTKGYQGALDQNQRQMERMGVNPNSGRYQATAHEGRIGQAKDTAGAMNAARRATELQGMAMREGAAKFGRGMTSTGLAADSAALGAGNSASGNIAAGSQIRNANMNAAANWFGGAGAANSSAAGIMNTQHQNQLTGWAQEQANLMGAMQGIGGLAGSIGTAGANTGFGKLFGLRRGGVIRGNRAYATPRRYAEGGLVGDEEAQFQNGIRQTPWYSEYKREYGEEPDLDTPDYNYREAWRNNLRPEINPHDGKYHWPSGYTGADGEGRMLKSENHPTMWKEKFMQAVGTDPDELGIKSPAEAEEYLKGAKGFARGGLVRRRRRGYAAGGMIEGPGTGTSDSIPGNIEGQEPVRLSNGEAVLNADAVDLVGEEFIHRVNSGGLAMSGRAKREG